VCAIGRNTGKVARVSQKKIVGRWNCPDRRFNLRYSIEVLREAWDRGLHVLDLAQVARHVGRQIDFLWLQDCGELCASGGGHRLGMSVFIVLLLPRLRNLPKAVVRGSGERLVIGNGRENTYLLLYRQTGEYRSTALTHEFLFPVSVFLWANEEIAEQRSKKIGREQEDVSG
jgi:hypothetical protein